MLMISLDWWVYEIAVLMTGWLPNAQAALSVGGICVALNTWWVGAGRSRGMGWSKEVRRDEMGGNPSSFTCSMLRLLASMPSGRAFFHT
jgi:hypothetical protein